MNKLDLIKWIDSLEEQAKESDKFFTERNDLYQEKQKLIKYIEDKIKECKNTLEKLEGTGSHRIPVLNARIYGYEDLLERIKNNNYD